MLFRVPFTSGSNLSLIFNQISGEELFNTGAEHSQRQDIVSLPAFTEDGWWYKNFTSRQQVVNMRDLLTDAFSHLPEKLPVAAPLLAMTFPPKVDESDTSFWLDKLLTSDWGNCMVDLRDKFHEICTDRDKAIYRLASYVAYEGSADITPNCTLTSGHFVAYFCEEDVWYKADDSTVQPTEMGGATPTVFPYICIFERVDLDVFIALATDEFRSRRHK